MPRRILPPTVPGGERVSLNRQQLDELARVGHIHLSSAQEVELQCTCTEHLILMRFEQASSPAATATEVFDNLLRQLHDLMGSISDLLGKETPQHHHVHMEIRDNLEKSDPAGSCTVNKLLDLITALYCAAGSARKEHQLIFGGRGRPSTNEGLRMFIWYLADFFEETGGKASAPYQGMIGRPDSPFARWVRLINSYLPPEIQAKDSLLPDLVREVCRIRRHKRRLLTR